MPGSAGDCYQQEIARMFGARAPRSGGEDLLDWETFEEEFLLGEKRAAVS